MKTILLVIALVAKADAPKAGLPAVAAAVTVVGEIAPTSAAVLDVAVVGEVAPMGAAWRLEAARKCGDEEAVRRLEMMLDTLLVEAVSGGEM